MSGTNVRATDWISAAPAFVPVLASRHAEMDLIMGRFADATVEQLTPDELAEFEQLMEAPDRELLAWITGEADVPPGYDTALFRRLRDFSHRQEPAR